MKGYKKPDRVGQVMVSMSRPKMQESHRRSALEAAGVKTLAELEEVSGVTHLSPAQIEREYHQYYVDQLWQLAGRDLLPDGPTGIG